MKTRGRLIGRSRVMALAALAILLAAGCAGKNCNCACSGCGGKPPAPAGAPTAPGAQPGMTIATGPQPGSTAQAGATAGELSITDPHRPALVLDYDTTQLPDLTPYKGPREQRLRDLLEKGDGQGPPAAPSALSAAPAPNLGVELTWLDNAADEVFFQLDRAPAGGSFTTLRLLAPNTTRTLDGPLAPGDYSYRVRSLSPTGASAFAGPATVTLEPPDDKPILPENLRASTDPEPRVDLTWTCRADNVEWFRVERAVDKGDFESIGLTGPSQRAFTDTRVEVETAYAYQVVAGNRAGESEPSEIAFAMIMNDPNKPAAPFDLRAEAIGPNAVSLTWLDGSDNEDRFLVERRIEVEGGKYLPVMAATRDATKAIIGGLTPGLAATFRVRAENRAGQSDPTADATAIPEGEALATYTMLADPSGKITVQDQPNPLLPRFVVQNVLPDAAGFTSDIGIRNPDPSHRLENVYVLVEEIDAQAVILGGCDRGPPSCSVDEAMVSGRPIGYQYTEDGFMGQVLSGGEVENYPSKLLTYAVRDISPACGQVTVKWKFRGLTQPTTLAVNLYATPAAADFRDDPRFDPEMSTWLIEPYFPGLDDGIHEPGSILNPYARPARAVKNGDIIAVNVSVEAADWMERQSQIGRLQDEPRAFYAYYHLLAFGLTYNPAVIRPLSGLVIMPDGSALHPGLRDPLIGNPLADGWSTASLAGGFNMFPLEGWIQAIFTSTTFTSEVDKAGNLRCLHCGQEGFVGASGAPQGPDPDPEAVLGLVYFQVVGPPGSSTPLRLAPRPQTAIETYSTEGTIKDKTDDKHLSGWREVNKQLPPIYLLPGEYQARDSYLCVE